MKFFSVLIKRVFVTPLNPITGKSPTSALVLGMALAAVPMALQAGPKGGVIKGGSGTINLGTINNHGAKVLPSQ